MLNRAETIEFLNKFLPLAMRNPELVEQAIAQSRESFVLWCHAQNPEAQSEMLPYLILVLEADEGALDTELRELDRLSDEQIRSLTPEARQALRERLEPALEKWLLGPVAARFRLALLLEKFPNLRPLFNYDREQRLYGVIRNMMREYLPPEQADALARLEKQIRESPRTWCGSVERFSPERAHQTIRVWNRYKKGEIEGATRAETRYIKKRTENLPANAREGTEGLIRQLAREFYPEIPRRPARMRVRRTLDRVYRLIYGTDLPRDRHQRRRCSGASTGQTRFVSLDDPKADRNPQVRQACETNDPDPFEPGAEETKAITLELVPHEVLMDGLQLVIAEFRRRGYTVNCDVRPTRPGGGGGSGPARS